MSASFLLPFTTEQFLNTFGFYNEAIFPSQGILVLLALVSVYLALRPRLRSNSMIATVLAVLWFWSGVIYHAIFFSQINRAAYLFALVFVVQGSLFLLPCVTRQRLQFQARGDAPGIAGGILIIYALIIYPMLGHLLGHTYPRSPTFGAPCPVTIFTLGLLLWTADRLPLYLLILPLLWSFVGFTATIFLGMYEDLGLLIAGLLTASLVAVRHGGHLIAKPSN